jgi:hypothetical protein
MTTELNLSDYIELSRARALIPGLTWVEDGDGTPMPAGDVGGDAQLDGASLSRAFWAELPNGLHARIEIAFFVGEAPERRHSDLPADEDKSLHMQTEYLICSDRNDPGGTETNAEYIHDADVAPELRATSANVLFMATRLNGETVGWDVDEERVLSLLVFGLPPVTEAAVIMVEEPTRRLHIGAVPIGSITTATTDAGARYLACIHDWDNGGPTPISERPALDPGPDYDPMMISVHEDWAEALRAVVTRVPPRLSRSLYSPATATEETPA